MKKLCLSCVLLLGYWKCLRILLLMMMEQLRIRNILHPLTLTRNLSSTQQGVEGRLNCLNQNKATGESRAGRTKPSKKISCQGFPGPFLAFFNSSTGQQIFKKGFETKKMACHTISSKRREKMSRRSKYGFSSLFSLLLFP